VGRKRSCVNRYVLEGYTHTGTVPDREVLLHFGLQCALRFLPQQSCGFLASILQFELPTHMTLYAHPETIGLEH
jgi:hypothetical protein